MQSVQDMPSDEEQSRSFTLTLEPIMRHEQLQIDRHELVFWMIVAFLAVLIVLALSPQVIAVL